MKRWIVLAFLTMLSVVGISGTALAHDKLDSTSPAAGATVATAPRQVRLTFNERVDPAGASVKVAGPTGGRLDVGPARVAGDVVTVNLAPAPVHGLVTVQWRIVSADGHPVGGSFRYTVAGGPDRR